MVVLVAGVVLLWVTSAQSAPPALGVTDAKRQAETLEGKSVNVRGNILEGTIVEQDGRVLEFVIGDAFERLRVDYNQTPPDNFGAKEVVVKGVLALDADGHPFLHASSIQVGCSSKY